MADNWLDRATPVSAEGGGWLARATPVGDDDEETVRKYQEAQEKYGGLGGELKAAGLGAVKGLTFGLGTQALTKSGLVDPETIKGLEEANPKSSVAGEIGGVIGGLALPVGELGALVKGVTKVGGAVERGAAALLPEATTLAGKVIQGAGTKALGSAAEGAAFGLGHVIHEEALGDPDLNAEKILSTVGYGAALGGIFGAALGAPGALLKDKFPGFVSSVSDASLKDAVTHVPQAEREGIIAGLTKLKPNAKEIESAAAAIDAPVLESQISASKAVQDLDTLLINNPASPVGMARQQLFQEGVDKAEKAALEALGPSTGRTQVEIGEAVKESLTKAITAENEPIAALYNNLKQSTDHIPVSEKAKEVITANIKKLENYKFPGSLERKIGDQVIRDFEAIQTVDDIKRYKTMLNKSVAPTAAPGERYAVERVVEKLSNLEEASILRAADDMAAATQDPAVRESITSLIKDRANANTAYKALRGKMEELGAVLGKKRIGGTADFLEFIDDLTPEKITKRLFAKGDSKFLKFFSESFPEQMAMVKEYEKNRLLGLNGMFKDDKLQINKLLKAVNDYPAEVRGILFTPEELAKFKAVQTYIEALPKNMNPSGTSHAIEARNFLQKIFGSWKEAGAGAGLGGAIAGPPGAIIGGLGGLAVGGGSEVLRDIGIKKLIQAAVNATDAGGITSIVNRLATVERVINNATNNVESYAGRVFKKGIDMVQGVKNPFIQMSYPEKVKEFEKINKDLTEKTNSPDQYLDHVTQSTSGLYDIAPATSGGVQFTLTRATEFLKSKLPQTNPMAPLSKPLTPSDAEISKFFRYYAVVENPMLAMKQVKDGVLVPETMEVLENVYPRLLGEMRTAVFDKLAGKKNKGMELPFNTKVMLSAFLGRELVSGLTSASISSNQASLNGPSHKEDNVQMAELQNKKPSQKGMESLTISKRSNTGSQAVIDRRLNG